jgi:protease secretion system outer membrane protein
MSAMSAFMFRSNLQRIALCAAILSLPAGTACALGLMQAYDAALQHDAIYRSALLDNEAGQQYKAIGRSSLLPTLQYNYGTGKNKAEITQPDIFGHPNTSKPDYTSSTSSLSLRQSLFNLDAGPGPIWMRRPTRS